MKNKGHLNAVIREGASKAAEAFTAAQARRKQKQGFTVTISRETRVEAISRKIRDGLYALARLAEAGKNKDAAMALVDLTRDGIYELDLLESESQELVRELAGQEIAWPGWISNDRDIIAAEQARAKSLRVAHDVALNYSGRKQWSRKTPETSVALHLWDSIDRKRKQGDSAAIKLKPFTKATSNDYYKFAAPLLRKYYGEQFENHPIFARYKIHPSAIKPESLSAITTRRQMILTKLEQSFRTIAPKARANKFATNTGKDG